MTLYTAKQLAAARGVTPITVRRWIKGVRGVRLAYSMRDGRSYQISDEQVSQFLAELARARQPREPEAAPRGRAGRVQTHQQRRDAEARSRTLGFRV